MRAIQNNAFGDPIETLSLIDLPLPGRPGADEVVIAMEFAPINGSDMLIITGRFKFSTKVPAFVGNEGVGHVIETGSNVKNVKVGDRVVPPLYSWTWRERLIVPAESLVALPESIDVQQLAMLRINPITAVLLVERFVELKQGDWIVQNMGNSGVGRSVIALARSKGLRTISLVRRPELVSELRDAGGDVVLVDGADTNDAVKRAVGDGNVRLALDGLSGPAGARLIELLSQNGTLVSYSFLSGDMNMAINVIDLHARGITLRGIYQALPEYTPYISSALQTSVQLMASGRLKLAVDGVYPMAEFKEAVAHSLRGGKVLLDLREGRAMRDDIPIFSTASRADAGLIGFS